MVKALACDSKGREFNRGLVVGLHHQATASCNRRTINPVMMVMVMMMPETGQKKPDKVR